MKITTNKYAILGDQEEDNGDLYLQNLSTEDKKIVDEYVPHKQKPPEDIISKWKQSMFSYFKESWKAKYDKGITGDKNVLNEKEVYADKSEMAKFMTANEVSGQGNDCFVKE